MPFIHPLRTRLPRWLLPVTVAVLVAALPLRAQEEDRSFTLAADPALVDSGILDHLVVRFALKTQRRAEIVTGAADLTIAPGGEVPVLQRDGLVHGLTLATDDDAADRFAKWLLSDVGRDTIRNFEPAQGPVFSPPDTVAAVAAPVVFDGDVRLGQRLAALHCGRCHSVSATDRMNSIDSAPSFGALRAIPDWERRFTAFYALNPHPALMRIDGISPPFDPDRPPTVVPVLLTTDEAEAIQAYAASVQPADLGAPVAHQ